MKWTAVVLLYCGWMLSAMPAQARLADTLDQAEARYGLEKPQPKYASSRGTLLEGAREVTFEHAGWIIRCALLQATDGNFYVVREEYRKIWNSQVMKAGGVIQIRDFERDATLEAEGGTWTLRQLADRGPDVSSTMANQFLRSVGITKAWMRNDGATARMDMAAGAITFDLPQALKHEADLKATREQKARTQARQILGQPAPSPVLPSEPALPSMTPAPAVTNPHVSTPSPAMRSRTPEAAAPSSPPRSSQNGISTPGLPVAVASILPATALPHPPASKVPFTMLALAGVTIVVAKFLTPSRSKRRSTKASASRSGPLASMLSSSQETVPPPLPTAARARTVKDSSWDEFELLVGEIYRRRGFRSEFSAGTGADGGIDLVLRRGEERVLVQCKSWNAWKVGPKEIREFFGVLVSDGATRGIFVTTGRFTRDATEFAEGKPIEMIDGSAFERMLREAATGPGDDLLDVASWMPAFLAASKVTQPDCPFCRTPMVKRKGRGNLFWGCPTYPKCRGKREMRKHVETHPLA
jgi:restriction system protein